MAGVLLITSAGVFGPLAAAAGVRLQLEAEVLRLGLGSLFELYHEVVAVAFGQFPLADQHVTFLFKQIRG